ncbi:gas vesicle protein GvpO [Alloyangia pacifica]|uniref:gas vesicle protein GvpO n=1 Tax=Alloyangia pacifica TaxID=311180 RepID=UPI0031D89A11
MTARKRPAPPAPATAPAAAAQTGGPGRPISLQQAMDRARAALQDITPLPIEGIASSERDPGGWRIVAEVLEAPARMGDNDLLAAYELALDPTGELTGFRRLRRYHREDREE